MKKNRIVYNAIRTPDGTVLVSRNRHDLNTYTDHKNGVTYMVDGGWDYLKRYMLPPEVAPEELSVSLEDGHEKVREVAAWGTRGLTGSNPLEYILIKDMEEAHIKKCLELDYISDTIRQVFEDELKWRK